MHVDFCGGALGRFGYLNKRKCRERCDPLPDVISSDCLPESSIKESNWNLIGRDTGQEPDCKAGEGAEGCSAGERQLKGRRHAVGVPCRFGLSSDEMKKLALVLFKSCPCCSAIGSSVI